MPPFRTAERIHAVEGITNYKFYSNSRLGNALEAAGATMASQENKRLALIGDAALRLVLYEFSYKDDASIRDMTNAQNTWATNVNLAQIGFSLGLDAYIQLNPSAQGVIPERLMATTIEAIIGAVYLDSNKDMTVLRCLIAHLRIMPRL